MELTVTKNRHFNTPLVVVSNTLAKDTLATFPMGDKGWKYAINVANGSAAGVFTIKAGDGYNATDDLSFDMAASTKYTITIESDAYKFLNGADADLVKVISTSACTVEIIKLP